MTRHMGNQTIAVGPIEDQGIRLMLAGLLEARIIGVKIGQGVQKNRTKKSPLVRSKGNRNFARCTVKLNLVNSTDPFQAGKDHSALPGIKPTEEDSFSGQAANMDPVPDLMNHLKFHDCPILSS